MQNRSRNDVFMHILVLCQYHPPDMGGGSRRVSNAIAGLEQLGHSIDIVTAFPHYPHGKVPSEYKRKLIAIEKESDKRIIRVWIPSIPHIGFMRRLLMYVIFAFTSLLALPTIRRPDIIWAANPNVFSSFPAMIYSLITRAPVVRGVDDLWPETAIHMGYLGNKGRKVGETLARISYTLAKKITPISSAYSEVLIHKYGVVADKIVTVEVGVDTDVFHPNKSFAPIKENQFTIVYSGLLGVAYDFETILEAANDLQTDSTIHFIIRGIGEMESSIRSAMIKRNLRNVTLSSDYLVQQKLIQLLANADVLILPMKSDEFSDIGLPTKLLEYMACGRPIICISAGEPARIVKESNCGIVVSPHNTSELVTAIVGLKESSELEELGRNGRKYAEANFSLEKIASKLEAAFQSGLK